MQPEPRAERVAVPITNNLTRFELAAVLWVTTRTVGNYVAAGGFPASVQTSKGLVWPLDCLALALMEEAMSRRRPPSPPLAASWPHHDTHRQKYVSARRTTAVAQLARRAGHLYEP
jgi:hypothetical protein